MADVRSSVTELPRSCKSAAERMARELAEEDRLAVLGESELEKLTQLEQELSKETGGDIALVAYRL